MVVMVYCASAALNILPYQNTSASLMRSIFLNQALVDTGKTTYTVVFGM